MIPKNCIGKELDKPFDSNRKFKKKQVCVKDGDSIKNIHYGDKRYQDYTQHKDKERRKNFRNRFNCDENKNKSTASFWACEDLW